MIFIFYTKLEFVSKSFAAQNDYEETIEPPVARGCKTLIHVYSSNEHCRVRFCRGLLFSFFIKWKENIHFRRLLR